MDGPTLLLVVIAAVAVAGFAKRLNLQVPLVLVTVGSVASFIPGVPQVTLSPELILGVVLPPLLYSAALDFSFVSFRKNLRHILRLGVVMVVVTTFVVGWFADWLRRRTSRRRGCGGSRSQTRSARPHDVDPHR